MDRSELGSEFSNWLPTIHDLMARIAYLYACGERPPDRRIAAFAAYTYRLADQAGISPVACPSSLVPLANELRDVLIEFSGTDAWQSANDTPAEHQARCRYNGIDFHVKVKAISGVASEYPLCDHLAWVGLKLENQKYDLKNVWPEPNVYYSRFESDRGRH